MFIDICITAEREIAQVVCAGLCHMGNDVILGCNGYGVVHYFVKHC